MQTSNVNLPIQVTCRHISITEPIRDYAVKKVEGLHLDFPRIIEAQVILDVQKHRHIAEVLLYCANHIKLEATAESDNLYAAMDEAMSKVNRQMRRFKTRFLRQHRPRKGEVYKIKKLLLDTEGFDQFEEAAAMVETAAKPELNVVETETYPIRPMYVDEAVLQLEVSSREFIVFTNAETEKVNILYRRKEKGRNYGLIDPNA